ncbi:MAG: DUF3298 domain-containing protein [Synergistaceae bacterium]|nr:RsiV family protein [Synergistota bacterium]NLM71819.1 DUF3298 domain-containing protein [Synergistaceae bacterium]
MRACRVCVAVLILAVLMAGVACGATVTYRKQVDGVRTTVTPVIGGMSPEVERAVNEALESLVEAEVASATSEEEPMEHVMEGLAELVGASLLSFSFYEMVCYEWAAHPSSRMWGITFDSATGDEILLGDLFIAGSDWRDSVDRLVRREVARQEAEEGLVLGDDGCPDLSRYSDQFFLRPGRLVFFWMIYQFTPPCCGHPEFELPISELMPYLNPDYSPW